MQRSRWQLPTKVPFHDTLSRASAPALIGSMKSLVLQFTNLCWNRVPCLQGISQQTSWLPYRVLRNSQVPTNFGGAAEIECGGKEDDRFAVSIAMTCFATQNILCDGLESFIIIFIMQRQHINYLKTPCSCWLREARLTSIVIGAAKRGGSRFVVGVAVQQDIPVAGSVVRWTADCFMTHGQSPHLRNVSIAKRKHEI